MVASIANSIEQMQLLGTILFAGAVLHTFLVKRFQHIGNRLPDGSVGENFFHLLGEIEIVFGFWAGIFILFFGAYLGPDQAVKFLEGLNFKEPIFVFAIMTVASTRPIISLTSKLIAAITSLCPIKKVRTHFYYWAVLSLGPILGSFITEPAAMTVTALVLKRRFFDEVKTSERFKYLSLGVLFVNISIGGTLTNFSAPPVLMVAGKWGWSTLHMFDHFGWKSVLAIIFNSLFGVMILFKELTACKENRPSSNVKNPLVLALVHILFLVMIVLSAHHISVFMGAFLFFLGVASITKEYQDEIKLKESLLVGFFLAGLVVFAPMQGWWLAPILKSLTSAKLFVGTTALTAITDNAALTYLGSQVDGISEAVKYALVAGAVAGGGLSIIANAPNPAGFAILRENFGPEGISPAGLFAAAIVPTMIAMVCLWFLPSL